MEIRPKKAKVGEGIMKAILVIDMPKNCAECPCCYGYYCPHLEREMGLWAIRTGKPVDCPLKPMPNEVCERLVEGLDAMEKMKSVEVRVVRRTE